MSQNNKKLNAQSKAGELAIEAFGNYGGGFLSSNKMFTEKNSLSLRYAPINRLSVQAGYDKTTLLLDGRYQSSDQINLGLLYDFTSTYGGLVRYGSAFGGNKLNNIDLGMRLNYLLAFMEFGGRFNSFQNFEQPTSRQNSQSLFGTIGISLPLIVKK